MNITSNENYITKELLEQEFANGLWHKDIAEKYGVGSRTIYTYVKKYGIKIERKNKRKEKILYTCERCGKQFQKLEDGLCHNCVLLNKNIGTETFSETESELGKKAINLRKQGLSFQEIANLLNCSKSTVSYHCKKQTREKTKKRSEKQTHKRNSEVAWMTLFSRRYNGFCGRKPRKYKKSNLKWKENGQWWYKFKNVIKKFQLRTDNIIMKYYKSEDALKHLNGPYTKCYLTGIDIDMTKDDYQLDHILPTSRGGTNELSNLGIICPEVNQMKGPLTTEELFYWCQKILEHNGYTVIKNENIETQSE